jgi:hypothetical protein
MTPPLSQQFRISPLIRLTLLLLYVALTLPLPMLAHTTAAPVPPNLLWIGLLLGGVLIYAALQEQVEVSEAGLGVGYPRWIKWLYRRHWYLPWQEIQAIKPRSTGQGGLVYYLVSTSGEGYLLPMRIAGFAALTRVIQAHTDLDTQSVRPLAQPWMYLILLVCTLVLLLVDASLYAMVLPRG